MSQLRRFRPRYCHHVEQRKIPSSFYIGTSGLIGIPATNSQRPTSYATPRCSINPRGVAIAYPFSPFSATHRHKNDTSTLHHPVARVLLVPIIPGSEGGKRVNRGKQNGLEMKKPWKEKEKRVSEQVRIHLWHRSSKMDNLPPIHVNINVANIDHLQRSMKADFEKIFAPPRR